MNIRKFFTLFMALAIWGQIYAQTSSYEVKLPDVLPASPEPWAFVKSGLGNANLSTGAATASIPLYSITLADYSFPISLSYSTQGLKADEACTRVGMGWVLNSTGMITRSVRDKPDEFAQRLTAPLQFVDTGMVIGYLENGNDPNSSGDTQADEFRFNVNGLSGTFVLDQNMVPRITSTSNVKIDVQISVTPGSTSGAINIITLTAPNGVIYKFGQKFEKTTTHNAGVANPFKNVTKTAFFLDKIELPTGQYINFNYTPINTRVQTGRVQTLQSPKASGVGTCGGCGSLYKFTDRVTTVEYSTNYLSSITTSNGLTISFTYASRNDLSYDNRLIGMDVGNIKKFMFNYYDVPNAGITGRFFLTRLREIRLSEVVNIDSSYDHVFTYDRLDQVPLPLTFSQDYLGFYNARGNGYLVPPSVGSDGNIDFTFRNPSWDAAKIGTLSSIRYPTGGREDYIYESNTVGQYENRKKDTYTTIRLDGTGNANGTAGIYSYSGIYAAKNHTATIALSVDDAILNDGISADPAHNTATVRLFEGANLLTSRSVLGYGSNTYTFNLEAGHSYRLELSVKNTTERGVATLSYDPTSTDVYENIYVEKEIPGLRLKQIKYTDPLTWTSHCKYFKYSPLANLNETTGSVIANVTFKSGSKARIYCGPGNDAYTACDLDVFSSNSSSDVYSYVGSGSLIYYKSVIESDDPDFLNGGTEYTFYDNDLGGNNQSILGDGIPYLTNGQKPSLSGKVFTKKLFDKNKAIVESEQTDYETMEYLGNVVYSFNVRKKYEPHVFDANRMDAYDVVKTTYGNYWIRPVTNKKKSYVNASFLENVTNYAYGTTANIEPLSATTTDSRSKVLKTEMKYPTDFVGDPIMDKLIARNILAPVILQSSYQDGVLLQQKKTIYDDWYNDSKILMPKTVQLKTSPTSSLINELEYKKYDVKGNLLQVGKSGDVQISYVWDALYSLPVCEAKGADFDQIAYANFETEADYGGWQWVSGSQAGAGFTGTSAFTGSLIKTISKTGSYLISLWTNGSATVNGASGTLIKTARGWNLYEWKFVNPTTITVAGTSIDDLRLYPAQALMMTYTYKPFVGVTSKTDPTGNVVYYEYDLMSRLIAIRDIDNNILKNYEYAFVSSNENKASVWMATGNNSCKPCELNGAYSSGIQIRQEKDINPQSPTYGVLRSVEVGYEGTCKDNAVWQFTATAPRCIKNAGNYNTGMQEKEQMDVNPCSKTYGMTRWVPGGTNYTSCPLPCPDCTAISRKCIGLVCEYGNMEVVSSTNNGTGSWTCVYRYKFSDGSYSETFTVTSSNGCPVD